MEWPDQERTSPFGTLSKAAMKKIEKQSPHLIVKSRKKWLHWGNYITIWGNLIISVAVLTLAVLVVRNISFFEKINADVSSVSDVIESVNNASMFVNL